MKSFLFFCTNGKDYGCGKLLSRTSETPLHGTSLVYYLAKCSNCQERWWIEYDTETAESRQRCL